MRSPRTRAITRSVIVERSTDPPNHSVPGGPLAMICGGTGFIDGRLSMTMYHDREQPWHWRWQLDRPFLHPSLWSNLAAHRFDMSSDTSSTNGAAAFEHDITPHVLPGVINDLNRGATLTAPNISQYRHAKDLGNRVPDKLRFGGKRIHAHARFFDFRRSSAAFEVRSLYRLDGSTIGSYEHYFSRTKNAPTDAAIPIVITHGANSRADSLDTPLSFQKPVR